MGWSNVGAVAITTTAVILVDNTGAQTGSLDGQNGLVIYGDGTAGNPGLQITGFGDFLFGGNNTPPLTLDGSIEFGSVFTGGTERIAMIMGSGAVDAGRSEGTVEPYSASPDGTKPGGVLLGPTAQTYDPNVIGSPVPETWHAPTFANGWGNFGGVYGPAGYRLSVEGDMVQFRGVIGGGTKTDGTVMFTVPAPYRPSVDRTTLGGGGTNGASVGCHITSGGNVLCEGIGAMSAFMALDGITYSL